MLYVLGFSCWVLWEVSEYLIFSSVSSHWQAENFGSLLEFKYAGGIIWKEMELPRYEKTTTHKQTNLSFGLQAEEMRKHIEFLCLESSKRISFKNMSVDL